jgi:hypothetical protein
MSDIDCKNTSLCREPLHANVDPIYAFHKYRSVAGAARYSAMLVQLHLFAYPQ